MTHDATYVYGVATISRSLKITCLFCRISPLLKGCFVKETYDLMTHDATYVYIYMGWLRLVSSLK